MDSFKCVYKGGIGEIEEKKSRFIATVKAVESEDEAAAFINEIKKQYWDARHNCSAFVIGENAQLTRCSDDGEPAGTAGRPMLELLLNEGIRNVAVVVTRYFGGTLLGTGGLIRAYQAAVKAGLNNSVIIQKEHGIRLSVKSDYNGIGRLQYLFSKEGYPVLSTDYGSDVIAELIVPLSKKDEAIKEMTKASNGRSDISIGDECIYALAGEDIICHDPLPRLT